MLWFCGGHGVCLTGAGHPGPHRAAVVAWLKRYVAGDTSVDTGPKFEWLADDAQWRSAADYPVAAGHADHRHRQRHARAQPRRRRRPARSPPPGRAVNAVNVAVPPPSAPTQIVGEPQLALTYCGHRRSRRRHVFAQLVDEARGVVVGNQATPIPVTLDGQPHTITRPLEAIAASAPAGAKYTLQLIGGTLLYGPVRAARRRSRSAQDRS